MLAFSAFVLTGNILFRSMSNGNCLFSSASFSMVGDNALVHELRVMKSVELGTFKCNIMSTSIYEKRQYLIGGTLFSSNRTVFLLAQDL